jgi:hypothetical protein
MTYSVNLWGSNPELDNDDCWTGLEFETKGEAIAAYLNAKETFGDMSHHTLTEGEWVQIDGPDIHMERALTKNEWVCSKKQARLDDGLWASERKWEHRMLHGTAD